MSTKRGAVDNHVIIGKYQASSPNPSLVGATGPGIIRHMRHFSFNLKDLYTFNNYVDKVLAFSIWQENVSILKVEKSRLVTDNVKACCQEHIPWNKTLSELDIYLSRMMYLISKSRYLYIAIAD